MISKFFIFCKNKISSFAVSNFKWIFAKIGNEPIAVLGLLLAASMWYFDYDFKKTEYSHRQSIAIDGQFDSKANELVLQPVEGTAHIERIGVFLPMRKSPVVATYQRNRVSLTSIMQAMRKHGDKKIKQGDFIIYPDGVGFIPLVIVA